MKTISPGTPANSFTSICECGHPWRWHEQSGQTNVGPSPSEHRACWGWVGQTTPYTMRPCDCQGFRPWRVEADQPANSPRGEA